MAEIKTCPDCGFRLIDRDYEAMHTCDPGDVIEKWKETHQPATREDLAELREQVGNVGKSLEHNRTETWAMIDAIGARLDAIESRLDAIDRPLDALLRHGITEADADNLPE